MQLMMTANKKIVDLRSEISLELIQRYRFIPLQKKENVLQIGIVDATDRQTVDALQFYTGLTIQPITISEDQLNLFIEKNIREQNKVKHLILPKELTLENNLQVIQENPVNYDEPLIKFVDELLQHAIQQATSDIHIEPYETSCRIRYRQDGLLREITEIPIQLASRLVTRLKVMAKLDITERRLPQDGRIQRNGIDIRFNSCPTLFGEKMVLRLLDASKVSLDIDSLGLNDLQKQIFLQKISQPQGLILVTGPTGSGKTVTLYSALNYLNQPEKNILTVENPVEIQLKGINQVNINPKIGLDFSNTLRTFLRQDPDIIMVGEIRDQETAAIAIQAAQTGHLVFATLHTNHALETLNRLQSMGIAPHQLASSISLIIAQRLVRKLCLQCNIQMPCGDCIDGFKNRVGIYEFLPITTPLSELIEQSASTHILMEQMKREGFVTLRESGLEKIRQGITSLTELNRIISP
jgi:type IV pilus assembly protein PilB